MIIRRALSLTRIWILALAALIFLMASSAGAADGRTVSASVILNQIAAGEPVEYDGYTIEGALDLDKLTNLPSVNEGLFYQEPHDNLSGNKKVIASHISIINCTIKERVNFNNTMFIKRLTLRTQNLKAMPASGELYSRKAPTYPAANSSVMLIFWDRSL